MGFGEGKGKVATSYDGKDKADTQGATGEITKTAKKKKKRRGRAAQIAREYLPGIAQNKKSSERLQKRRS